MRRSGLGTNIAEVFQHALEERCRKNPRYSLRSFARDLWISPQRLSHLINGKKGLSAEAAEKLAGRLGMSDKEKSAFICLVLSKHARSAKDRARAQEALVRLAKQYQNLDEEYFETIADWYPLAILTLAEIEVLSDPPARLATRLSISSKQAEIAIRRLVQIGLLARTEAGLKVNANVFVQSKSAPSASIRAFHEQILEKAKQALQVQSLAERDFSQMYFGLDPSRMGEMRQFISRFRAEFEERFAVPRPSDRNATSPSLYSLNIQLFKICDPEPK